MSDECPIGREIASGLINAIQNLCDPYDDDWGENDPLITIIVADLRRLYYLLRPEKADAWAPTHRHVKHGTLYKLVSSAVLQADEPVVVHEFLALYQSQDGLFWVRPADEFQDGRFEALARAQGATKP